jgi:hypothetical protein
LSWCNTYSPLTYEIQILSIWHTGWIHDWVCFINYFVYLEQILENRYTWRVSYKNYIWPISKTHFIIIPNCIVGDSQIFLASLCLHMLTSAYGETAEREIYKKYISYIIAECNTKGLPDWERQYYIIINHTILNYILFYPLAIILGCIQPNTHWCNGWRDGHQDSFICWSVTSNYFENIYIFENLMDYFS